VETRESLRQEIIDKRVNELLIPALRWPDEHGEQQGTSPRLVTPTPLLEGQVLQYDKERQFVEISLGADDGLKLRDVLNVIRATDESTLLVAKVSVCQVEADRCLARVEQQHDEILSGDRVRNVTAGDLISN
jgi:hypothetical protein